MARTKSPRVQAAPVSASSTDELPLREEPPALPLPEVQNMPPAIQAMTYAQRLALVNDALCRPRRFLLQATDGDILDPSALPKADNKKIPYEQLRAVIAAFLPDWKSTVSGRRLQSAFLLHQLGELSPDELDHRVVGLVNVLLPYALETREAKLNDHRSHLADVIKDIDAEIARCIAEGQRHPDIIATKDLPPGSVTCVHSDNDLFWELTQPLHIACIRYDVLPKSSPLKQFDPKRIPGLTKTGGPFVVLLGPAQPGTLWAAPRPWYNLATSAVFTTKGFKNWANRHRVYLDYNREERDGFDRFFDFEELIKKPYPPPWSYPDPPAVPPLDGFQTRVLFAIDLVGHLARYVTRPPTNLALPELLLARRILVEAGCDQSADVASNAARVWIGTWSSHNHRSDLYDAIGSIASSTLKAIEDLEEKFHDSALAEFQARVIFAGGGK